MWNPPARNHFDQIENIVQKSADSIGSAEGKGQTAQGKYSVRPKTKGSKVQKVRKSHFQLPGNVSTVGFCSALKEVFFLLTLGVETRLASF